MRQAPIEMSWAVRALLILAAIGCGIQAHVLLSRIPADIGKLIDHPNLGSFLGWHLAWLGFVALLWWIGIPNPERRPSLTKVNRWLRWTSPIAVYLAALVESRFWFFVF